MIHGNPIRRRLYKDFRHHLACAFLSGTKALSTFVCWSTRAEQLGLAMGPLRRSRDLAGDHLCRILRGWPCTWAFSSGLL